MPNTNSCQPPKTCTCDAVYDQLHWEWCHKADCQYDPAKEKFDPKEAYERRQRVIKHRVLYAVSQNRAHCISSRLLKEFAPEILKLTQYCPTNKS